MPDPSKIDPRLRAILSLSDGDLDQIRNVEAAAARPRPGTRRRPRPRPSILQGLRFDGPPAGAKLPAPTLPQATASVLIKLRPAADPLPGYVTVRARMGDIVTALVPLRRIPELVQRPDVVFIELSGPAKLTDVFGDSGAAEIGATQLRAKSRAGDFDGRGVVIAVVDSGVDFHHPTFRNEKGSTRIEAIWDQLGTPGVAGRTPPGLYGVEYTATDIDADLQSGKPYSVVPHVDAVDGDAGAHGTFVTSLAAGSGRCSADDGSARFPGVAPAATIVVIAIVGSGEAAIGELATLAEAIDYAFRRADGRPCVVNVSLGDGLGPHDGTSLVEQFIDNACSEPGRAVVVAAGNSNRIGKHVSGAAHASEPILLRVFPGQSYGDALQIWYPSSHELDIVITSPGGAGRSIPFGSAASFELGGTRFLVTSTANDGRNGDNVIEVVLNPAVEDGTIDAGLWSLQLVPRADPGAVYDAWLDSNEDNHIVFEHPVEDVRTVTTPATSKLALTIGMYNETKAVDDLSGRGPTRRLGKEERRKPDFVARGTNIIGAIGRDWSTFQTPTPEMLYGPGMGTSVATPLVAGAVALVFQRFGDQRISSTKLRAVLDELVDVVGLQVPSESAGLGRVCVTNLDTIQ